VFNDLPGWVVPLVSSVLTGLGTLLAAVLSYKNQSKKISIEYNDSNARLKEVDLAEIKAIAEGNKALREALIERVDSYERTFSVMREAHQDCERRLEDIEVELRQAKRRLNSLESTVDEQRPDKDYRSR
jgi:phage shock protein A